MPLSDLLAIDDTQVVPYTQLRVKCISLFPSSAISAASEISNLGTLSSRLCEFVSRSVRYIDYKIVERNRDRNNFARVRCIDFGRRV